MVKKFNISGKVKCNIDGYDLLSSLCDQIRLCKEDEIVVCFDGCEEFDSNLSAIIGDVLEDISDFKQVYVKKPDNELVYKNLVRNRFFPAFQKDYKMPESERESYLPFRSFKIKDAVQFKEYIAELIHKRQFPRHSKKVGQTIMESIHEIYVNAIEHGKSRHITCCGEKHANTFDVTVVDCGTTIPETVNRFMFNHGNRQMDDNDTIVWAMGRGNTTKETVGGLGLAIICDFMNLNKGTLQIISGKGFIEYENSRHKRLNLNNPFPGTIVSMRFNLADKKAYFLKEEKIDLKNLL